MRRFMVSIVLGIALLEPLLAGGMLDGERQRLVAHLDMTERWLMSEVQGLSPDQANFRMAPESWTIAEVVEHLSIAEPQYWPMVAKSMRQEPWTTKPEATDAGILWYGIDRTNRTRTGEARVPGGKKDLSTSLSEFRKLRATILEYARTTTDDLRSRRLIEGNMDVYQWCLMISTHSQRHILQIREIKAHPRFPAKR